MLNENTLLDLLVLANGEILYVGEIDEVPIKQLDTSDSIKCECCALYKQVCHMSDIGKITAPCQNLDGDFTYVFKIANYCECNRIEN